MFTGHIENAQYAVYYVVSDQSKQLLFNCTLLIVLNLPLTTLIAHYSGAAVARSAITLKLPIGEVNNTDHFVTM